MSDQSDPVTPPSTRQPAQAPAGRRRPGGALAEQVVGVALVGTLVAVFGGPGLTQSPYVTLVGVVAVMVLAVTGAILVDDPEQRANGRLLTVAGGLFAVSWVHYEQYWYYWSQVAFAVELQSVLPIVCVLLRYPETRMSTRSTRVFAVCAALGVPLTLVLAVVLWDPAWKGYSGSAWWPALLRNDTPVTSTWQTEGALIHDGVTGTAALGTVVLLVVGSVLLIRRVRRTRGPLRGVLRLLAAPTLALVGAAVVNLFVSFDYGDFRWAGLLSLLINLLLLAVAGAFVVAGTRRKMAAAPVAELLRVLGQRDADVRDALRRTLDDPDLDVHFWVGKPHPDGSDPPDNAVGTGYVDRDGRPVNPTARPGRSIVSVTTPAGAPLAAVDIASSVHTERVLLDAALTASALALENERLHAQVLAQLADVRASRARIVAAGIAERRAVERDLHDGAQQRLLALSTTLSRLRATADDATSQALIEQAREELRQSLAELRDLARGIHPAVLTQVGLRAALESVAERLPINVTIDLTNERLPEAVETTVYYVVCEALTNIVKHSGATSATVTVSRTEPVLVRITDDGRGIADPAVMLRGTLADRVRALGGDLAVRRVETDVAGESRPGGTVVEARLPHR